VASVKVERRLGRGVNGAEDRSVGIGRIRVPRQRANATRNVDDAGSRRLAQQRQHRLVYGEHAEYVGLPHCTHFIKGHLLGRVRLAYSATDSPLGRLLVFEMAALLMSRCRRPNSAGPLTYNEPAPMLEAALDGRISLRIMPPPTSHRVAWYGCSSIGRRPFRDIFYIIDPVGRCHRLSRL
jgi:hypothetical protein